jgi:tape measure domain-containing protein
MEGGDFSMSNIDERIVRMTLDSQSFASGASNLMSLLQALNKALKLEGASQGLSDVSSNLNKIDTSQPQGQVSALAAKFSALQVAAITALSNIVNRAVDAGLSLAKSLTIQPLVDGFNEYETQIGSIQTILANTGLKGAEGLNKVNDALNNLNHYADQTIYNFSEMTRNIGTFTAAGVSLDVATSAIKGIANLAAISGSNAQQASTAMYQLSQALAAGKVTLEDWNSVVNAGMGGKVFQDALVQTARVHGIAVDKIIKDEGSFRLSLQKGWLTGQVLTETLSKFTGELTDDQLKSMGYTQEQIKGIQEMARTAVDAATKVKTMSQLLDTLREAVGSGWAQAWQIVFGNFDQAKDLFTGVNNELGAIIQNSFKAFNGLLQGWADLGGRQAVIDGVVNGFHALQSILKPLSDAFSQVFPAATTKDLVNISNAFRDFMARLKIGAGTADELRRTFAGFFSILGIGWDLIKAGAKFIGDLVGKLTAGSGGFLNFTARVGDFLVALRKAIQDGQGFTKIFDGLEKILAVPIALFKALSTVLGELFKNANKGGDALKSSVGGMSQVLSPLQELGQKIERFWSHLGDVFQSVANKIGETTDQFIQWAKGVGQAISGVFSGGLDFDSILKAIGTGVLASLLLALKGFVKKATGIFKDGGGLFKGITEALEGFTGALKGMQNSLNAAALLGIAVAVGVLTLSLIGLSKIDAEGLTRGSIAIAGLFTELGAAFFAFNKITSTGSAFKIGVLGAGLILLGAAVDVLAIAVGKLGALSWDELIKGLTGVVVILGALVGASNLMDAAAPGMIRSGAALILMAAAVRVLVYSVEELAKMDWESLAKGITGVATLLVALALFTKFAEADKGGIAQGAGIILLATGLRILALAVSDFSKFDWPTMAKGLAGVAGGLGILTGAMNLLPAGSVFKATGILIVSAALEIIADAVKKMSALQWDEIGRGLTVLGGAMFAISTALALLPQGSIFSAAAILVTAASLEIVGNVLGKMAKMSWEEIAKGLVTLAGSLIIIAAALVVMDGTLPGSFALAVAAASLALLIPVFKELGGMSWADIIAGLVGLAGIFVILGAAGLLLTPVVPAIIGLGLAVTLLGVGVLAAGVGVLAFAAGLSLLATVGAAAIAVTIAAILGLAATIPYVATQLALGLVAFVLVIAQAAPKMLEAMTAVMTALLDAITTIIPKIVDTIYQLLDRLLQVIAEHVPSMVDSGSKILIGFLNGIAAHLKDIIDAGTNVVIAFIVGIGQNASRVAQAAKDTAVNFINSLAQTIRSGGPEMGAAGANLAEAIIQGTVNGLGTFASRVGGKLLQMAKDAWNTVLAFFGVNSPAKEAIWLSEMIVRGGVVGFDRYGSLMSDAAGNVAQDTLDSMMKPLTGLAAALGTELGDFNPVITPVLDLSQVQQGAASISDILALQPIAVNSARSSAQSADSGFESNRDTTNTTDGTTDSDKTFSFTQINNSPKALSTADIYRQTKNLVSTTREGS